MFQSCLSYETTQIQHTLSFLDSIKRYSFTRACQLPTISFLVRFNTTSEWYWWHTSKYKKGYHLKCVLYWAICHFFSRPTPSYCSRLNCIGWTKARACQERFLFWICQTIMNWLFWKSAPFLNSRLSVMLFELCTV